VGLLYMYLYTSYRSTGQWRTCLLAMPSRDMTTRAVSVVCSGRRLCDRIHRPCNKATYRLTSVSSWATEADLQCRDVTDTFRHVQTDRSID